MLDFELDGACILSPSIEKSELESMRSEFAALDFRAGARPFAPTDSIKRLLSKKGCFGQCLATLAKTPAKPVRILAFDKTPSTNWNLGWHQDRVVAVKNRKDVAGFENWTIKNGIHHVQPPAEFMAQMFTLRLHLDDCDASNGALKIIKGSHRLGRLSDRDVQALAANSTWEYCSAATGQVVAMKTLAIHSSSPSLRPFHRRVLHVDYSTADLPGGLEWALGDCSGATTR